jgi:hypothetical protein
VEGTLAEAGENFHQPPEFFFSDERAKGKKPVAGQQVVESLGAPAFWRKICL